MLLQLKKRAVAEVVAYVLLIVISLSLASMVFFWLKGQLPTDQEIDCDENISLNIKDYNYSCSSGQLNFTLQNKGLFNVAGHIIRVNNASGANLGFYVYNRTNILIETGDSYFYNLSTNPLVLNSGQEVSGVLTFLEVQPMQEKDGKLFICKDFISKIDLVCT